MSLSRQLILSLFSILLAVFIGTLVLNISNTRNSIEQQLSYNARDTATSFGLSITPYIGTKQDLPLVETMLNSIFDNGYYRSITIKDINNNIILEKQHIKPIEGVPNWFVTWFSLESPIIKSEINNGWAIAGSVSIQSQTSLGYAQLWRNTVQSFILISVVFGLGFGLILIVVRLITVPISEVVKQLGAISQQKFEPLKITPKTTELKVFVKAFNLMSERLSDLFTRLTHQAEQYREFAFIDNLTKVGNRRAFDLAFDGLLGDTEHQSQGFLIFIRLSSLNQVNQNLGFLDGDEYIKNVCGIINQSMETHKNNSALYRLNGADFCWLLNDVDEEQCIDAVKKLMKNCNTIEKSEYESGVVHVGAGSFTHSENKSQILEKVDSALTRSISKEQRWCLSSQLETYQNKDFWREQITNLLVAQQSEFVSQPVKNFNEHIEYQEWFARFRDPQTKEYLPMAEFIPVSIRLDFAQKLDELIISCAFKQMQDVAGNIGVNVSRMSLLQPIFQSWLLKELMSLGKTRERLVIEIPESALLSNEGSLASFISQLKDMGVKITIERFGAQVAAFSQLRNLRPDYLKLDGRYVQKIDTEQDNRLFVHSLVNIAHGLGIKVIAERVETEQEAQILKEMNIDFMQGYWLGVPQNLKS